VLALLLLASLDDVLLAAESALVVSLFVSVLASALAAESSLVTLALLLLRLSVIYQPEPLKTMPTGWNTRRTAPAHLGHVRSGSSLKDWNCSN
jgi:hypothetical protein